MSTLPIDTGLYNGQFKISGLLGQGGGGITYRAHDHKLKRTVAIKEFFPTGVGRSGLEVIPSASISNDFETGKAAFLEEARTLARFQHPNIVDVYFIFQENNTAYMVMEFVEGSSLLEIVETRGAFPEEKAVRYIETVGHAIEAMHKAGMLHRDIKPGNILADTAGRIVLIDFGQTRKLATVRNYETELFRGSAQAGTAGYAPLEQYSRTAQLSPATDVHALAATLYHLLAGHAPVEAVERATGAPLPSVQDLNPDISHHINRAIMRALSLEPTSRPQSIEEFLQQLKPLPIAPRHVFDNAEQDLQPQTMLKPVESPEVGAGQILVCLVVAIFALLVVFAFDYIRVVLTP